jgi:hypothetical protein
MFGLHFLFGVMLVFGYKTRAAVIGSFIMTVSVHNRNWLVNNGGDDILRALLFISIFLPLSKCFSVDSALTKEKKIERVLSTTELGPPPSHPHFFSSFSENELKYIYQQLEKKGVAHDKIASALSFSLDDEFWRKTIKTPDGFLKNFFRICDYLPKAFDEMNEEEQFRYAIKEIHKEFPLAKKCLIVHSEERCVQETGYGHHYSMEIGVDEFYRRVMWRYGKERTFRRPGKTV